MPEVSLAFGVPWPNLNDGILYNDIVPASCEACTVLDFYCAKYKASAPRDGWLRRIQNGQIKVDGNVVTTNDVIVRPGVSLTYHRLPWTEPPAPWKLEILYEDDDLLAVNKPSGLQVLSGGLYQQRTVLTQLMWRNIGQPTPVHRLGRGTSGVLLCAKTKAAKAKLSADFAAGTHSGHQDVAERRVKKVYRALATGIIEENEILVTQPIGTIKYPGVAKGLYVANSSGKPACSKVVVIHRNFKNNSTLVEVEIFSGRPHQIRIHLAYIGHPLIGDPLYVDGGKPAQKSLLDLNTLEEHETNPDDGGYAKPSNAVPGECGYHLHAHRLFIVHPIKDVKLEIVAPCPSILCTIQGQSTKD